MRYGYITLSSLKATVFFQVGKKYKSSPPGHLQSLSGLKKIILYGFNEKVYLKRETKHLDVLPHRASLKYFSEEHRLMCQKVLMFEEVEYKGEGEI